MVQEKAHDAATRLLTEMFTEVFATTGRTLPEGFEDKISDVVTAIEGSIYDRYEVQTKRSDW